MPWPAHAANAERLGRANVTFLRSDWYVEVPPGPFDAIVSNPPYIPAADPHLAEGDLRYEPRTALSPGSDGTSALRVIVAGAPPRLAAGGLLAVEHGYDQAETVHRLFVAAGFEAPVARRDLAGIPRVALARRASS